MTDTGSDGYGDLHSHLVPGVDDGVRDLEEALEAVGRMCAVGIRRIVTTPHLVGSLTREPEAFESRMESLDGAWQKVSREVEHRHPELEFERGHEVMIDVPDVDFSDVRVRLAGTDFVLVEWPRLQVPPGTPGVVSRIRFAGLRPVIAHPERYWGMDRDLEIVEEWRRMGAYLQVSYGSLLGRYGDEPRTRAFRLLKRGWADYLSSDFHGRPRQELHLERARALLEDEGGAEHFDLLARTNPSRVLRGQEPLSVPPLELRGGFWQRLKALFAPEPR